MSTVAALLPARQKRHSSLAGRRQKAVCFQLHKAFATWQVKHRKQHQPEGRFTPLLLNLLLLLSLGQGSLAGKSKSTHGKRSEVDRAGPASCQHVIEVGGKGRQVDDSTSDSTINPPISANEPRYARAREGVAQIQHLIEPEMTK